LDDDKKTLKLVASCGLSEKYLNKGPISAEKSIAMALKGKPVVVKNAFTDEGVQYKKEKQEEGIVSILCVPIKSKEDVIGVLRLYSDRQREFTDDEIILVTALAYQGGLAIQNASLYLMVQEDIKDLKENIWSHKSWF
jgi:GAF domain-containing protein